MFLAATVGRTPSFRQLLKFVDCLFVLAELRKSDGAFDSADFLGLGKSEESLDETLKLRG